jgi:hypothetical protein
VAHFRNITVKDSNSPRNIVDIQPAESGLGGAGENGLTYYFHDQPKEKRTTKVVAVELYPKLAGGDHYVKIEGFTGKHVKAKLLGEVEFPKLLDPVDDLPPATIVTFPPQDATIKLTDGKLIVRGTTTDNVKTKRVVVNGVEAKDIDYNFHQWEVELTGLKPGRLTIVAHAEDATGNIEKLAHRIAFLAE